MYDKDKQLEWNQVKTRINKSDIIRTVKDGEIWWCAMGANVGVEINGKGRDFARPVLVFRKLSRFGFIGIPLTSQPHEGSWYVKFRFKGKDEYAVLAQIRMVDTKRMYRKIGSADDSDMEMIREKLKMLLFPE